jgi:hypothetical protein
MFSRMTTGLKANEYGQDRGRMEDRETSADKIGGVEISPWRHIDLWGSTQIALGTTWFHKVFRAETTNVSESPCKRAGQGTERDSYREFRSLVDLMDQSLIPRSVYSKPLHLGH